MADYDETIIDATKPNAGRIYDYLIGGNHNFEIDRQMAEKLLKIAPYASDYAKLVRWFLGVGTRRAVKMGFTQFLDLASGLPTDDHIHRNTPPGTKVIYSDIDPVTVAYGKDIIGENPIVKYITCDASKPETLLQSEPLQTLFGSNHKVAIGLNGICWFLDKEQIKHILHVLYNWADEGSLIFFTAFDSENPTEEFKSFLTMYKNMNQPFYTVTKQEFNEIILNWKIEEPGFLTLEEWIGLDQTTTGESLTSMGGSIFAGFLKK